MTVSFPRFVRLFAVNVLLTACTTGQARLAEPSPGPAEGATTIAQVAQEAAAGRYGVADKLLVDYSARYPATPEAADATYWRAIFKMDPANPNASSREAVQLLDSYVAANLGTHKVEALSLRRVANALEARVTAPVSSSTAPKTELPKPEDLAKDEELRRVKEELAKANAELDRIKRRLAQPKP